MLRGQVPADTQVTGELTGTGASVLSTPRQGGTGHTLFSTGWGSSQCSAPQRKPSNSGLEEGGQLGHVSKRF